MTEDYKVGDDVEVFFRMRRKIGQGQMIYTSDCFRGLMSPRVGISDGWIPATVVEVSDSIIEVQYPHRYKFIDREGAHPDEEESLKERLPLWQVRKTPTKPLLTLFVVRWGGTGDEEAAECSDIDAGFWGSAGTSVCDNYINIFTDMFEKVLETRFEVVTAFVKSASDLDTLTSAASFITASMTGEHRAAMYFLWPVAFQDGATGTAGMVPEAAMFRLMHRIESTGVATRFPHPSHLYRCLVSKQWTAHLCLSPQYRIPATTRVSISEVRGRDIKKAALNALETLVAIRSSKARDTDTGVVSDGSSASEDYACMKGVVKLGYSWEAADVLSFTGAEELAVRLDTLSAQPGCLADVVYVQEYVTSKCEVRVYLVNGEIMHRRYTKPGRGNPETGRFEGFQDLPREEAIKQWFDNDEKLLDHAERAMDGLVQRWLLWVRCECSQPQPVIRFDFFVGVEDGKSVIHTGEITELGGSTLNWNKGPELIQRAVIAACLEGESAPPLSERVQAHYKFVPRHVRFGDEEEEEEEGAGESDGSGDNSDGDSESNSDSSGGDKMVGEHGLSSEKKNTAVAKKRQRIK
jgi:hypothetical protein